MFYDYKCQSTGEIIEVWARPSELQHEIECPCGCGHVALKLLNSKFNVNMNYRIDDIREYHRQYPIEIADDKEMYKQEQDIKEANEW